MPLPFSSLLSPALQTLKPYVPGEQPKIDHLVKLNTNECPFAPAPGVKDAVIMAMGEEAEQLRLYPDPDASALKEAVAEFYQLPTDHIFLGNGSDEVLAHAYMAFFRQGKDRPLLMPDITYSFYPVYAQLYDVPIRQIPLKDDFKIDPADYGKKAGGVILANPNAPTGIALSLPEIEEILQTHSESVVVIDEAYVDFGAQSAISLIAQYPNLLVCHTTSKSRSLAGMRIGMAFGQPHLISALEMVKNSFNSYPIDRLAIAAGIASFKDQEYFKNTRDKMIILREQLVTSLIRLGFIVLPSKANFVFTTHLHLSAAMLQQKLRAQAVIVRHFNIPRIDNYLRITVGNEIQNQKLIAALADILHA